MFLKLRSNRYPKLHVFYVLIVAISIVVLGLSFSIHPYEHFIMYRSLRVFISVAFIVASMYLYGRRLNALVYWHMVFYALASLAAIFFESSTNAGVVCMLLNFTSFAFLIHMLFGRIDFSAINRMFLFALLLGIAIHIWLIGYLMLMLYEVHLSIPLLIAFCISILGSFTVCVFALVYNYDHKSKSSIFLFSFITILVFSETFRGAGHYELIDQVMGQYWARALLVLAYILLFSFAYQEVYKKETDLLS